MSKVLIVEDEPKLAQLLADYLQQSSLETTIIGDGLAVEPWLKENAVDVILLDLMLPGKDGLSICQGVRQFCDTPIIMVTARVEEIDRLLGLELGADDYICKPFSPREVVARVKAHIRRSQINQKVRSDNIAQEGPIQVDDKRYKAFLQGKDLDLTAVEFQLLKLLVQEPGRIYSRNQIMDAVYHDHRVVSDRTMDSHVKKIRKKLAMVDDQNEYIISVYGVGYKFEYL